MWSKSYNAAAGSLSAHIRQRHADEMAAAVAVPTAVRRASLSTVSTASSSVRRTSLSDVSSASSASLDAAADEDVKMEDEGFAIPPAVSRPPLSRPTSMPVGQVVRPASAPSDGRRGSFSSFTFTPHVRSMPPAVAEVRAAPMTDALMEETFSAARPASAASSSPLRFASLDPSTGHLVYVSATALTARTVTSLVEFTHAAESPHWAEDADEYGLTPAEVQRMQARSERHRLGEVLDDSEKFNVEHTSNGVSVIVDPQHDMYVRVGASKTVAADESRTTWQFDDYRKRKAGSLLTTDVRQRVKVTGQAEAGLAASADELPFARALGLTTEAEVATFLELYGYWCGDGSLNDGHTRYVVFAPKKRGDKRWVLGRLATLGLTEAGGMCHSGCDAANGQRHIYVNEPAWVKLFFEEYGSVYGGAAATSPASTHTGLTAPKIKSVKWFSMWVWRLRKERARRVLAGLRFADGSEAHDINLIHTSGHRFRDDIIRLAVHAGYSAHFRLSYKKGDHRGYSADGTAIIARHDSWAVAYSDHSSAAEPVLKNHRDIKELAKPNGVPVWCVTVPPHNLIITRRFNKNDEGVVTQASRPIVVGNCVAEGTGVELVQGVSVPIESVQVGDCVHGLADDGQGVVDRPVTAVLARGARECVELLFSDGRTLTCTPDHRIFTADGRWVEARRLIVGETELSVGPTYPLESAGDARSSDAEWRIDLRSSLGFVLRTASPVDRARARAFARLLGALLSDGSATTDGSSATLHLGHQLDVDAARRDFETLGLRDFRPSSFRTQKTSSGFTQELPPRLRDAFMSLGVPRGERIDVVVTIPAAFTSIGCPTDVVRELLGGLFGGDGCAPCYNHTGGKFTFIRFVANKKGRVARAQQANWEATLVPMFARCGLVAASIDIDIIDPPPNQLTPAGRAAVAALKARGQQLSRVLAPDEQLQRDKSYRLCLRMSADAVLQFADRIGFRYCVHKAVRLSAAAACFRATERLREDRRLVQAKARPLFKPGRCMGVKQAVRQAVADLQTTRTLLPATLRWLPHAIVNFDAAVKTAITPARSLMEFGTKLFFSEKRTKKYRTTQPATPPPSRPHSSSALSRTSPSSATVVDLTGDSDGEGMEVAAGLVVMASGEERPLDAVVCLGCERDEDEHVLLLCAGCDDFCYHIYCLDPPLDELPEGDWYCTDECRSAAEAEMEEADEVEEAEEEEEAKDDTEPADEDAEEEEKEEEDEEADGDVEMIDQPPSPAAVVSENRVRYGVPRSATALPTFKVKLVSRRPVGVKNTFDLTVPAPAGVEPSFTANGVVVHNCHVLWYPQKPLVRPSTHQHIRLAVRQLFDHSSMTCRCCLSCCVSGGHQLHGVSALQRAAGRHQRYRRHRLLQRLQPRGQCYHEPEQYRPRLLPLRLLPHVQRRGGQAVADVQGGVRQAQPRHHAGHAAALELRQDRGRRAGGAGRACEWRRRHHRQDCAAGHTGRDGRHGSARTDEQADQARRQHHTARQRERHHRLRGTDDGREWRQVRQGACTLHSYAADRRQVRFTARTEGHSRHHVPAGGYAVHRGGAGARHHCQPARYTEQDDHWTSCGGRRLHCSLASYSPPIALHGSLTRSPAVPVCCVVSAGQSVELHRRAGHRYPVHRRDCREHQRNAAPVRLPAARLGGAVQRTHRPQVGGADILRTHFLSAPQTHGGRQDTQPCTRTAAGAGTAAGGGPQQGRWTALRRDGARLHDQSRRGTVPAREAVSGQRSLPRARVRPVRPHRDRQPAEEQHGVPRL